MKKDKPGKGKITLFKRPAAWVVDHLPERKANERSRELEEDVIALHFGRRSSMYEYKVQKLANAMLIGVIVLAMSAALIPLLYAAKTPVPGQALQRNDYLTQPQQEDLLAEVEGESEEQLLSLQVHERTFTSKKARELLAQAEEILDREILADNPSRDEVRSDLSMPASFLGGSVQAEYMTVPYGIVSETGQITGRPEEEGSLVEIKATLTCQEEELIYETAVQVLPAILTEEEQLWQKVEDLLRDAEQSSRSDESLKLPGSVDGRQITWSYPAGTQAFALLIFPLLLPALYVTWRDEQIRQKAKERSEQLQADYADLLWKMTLLLGAGLTIRSTVTQIASRYLRAKEENQAPVRYVYEELVYTCREMHSGISEGTSYIRFGKRCALPQYIKLGTLLEQNLKKGTEGLARTLELEAGEAMEDRINLARKKGEQAGTKLLFPMILMLLVVLAILMIPAFMLMGN